MALWPKPIEFWCKCYSISLGEMPLLRVVLELVLLHGVESQAPLVTSCPHLLMVAPT